ncbi:unnamed protein product [Vitrella brassicaformis CCMP3155]|uniref:Uncharacterized protein n=2 Tax=Vitrella brassicaformis TaxID=1169539 RepID=A0A0G4G7A9_VITBC|nr:unnamed protein product [Vitrella brassicaformis CCMP3155]|mmetsp:Transcript_39751/g.113348  ORF Transcript_39751/g.113348 Transcript_39751/m.113348 type:complete len:404 (+) Transcript_39751:15-1226(+)|eukprot:CEM24542.1 unnamed protein product [Vitrella brassicaformis CCMP3155]
MRRIASSCLRPFWQPIVAITICCVAALAYAEQREAQKHPDGKDKHSEGSEGGEAVPKILLVCHTPFDHLPYPTPDVTEECYRQKVAYVDWPQFTAPATDFPRRLASWRLVKEKKMAAVDSGNDAYHQLSDAKLTFQHYSGRLLQASYTNVRKTRVTTSPKHGPRDVPAWWQFDISDRKHLLLAQTHLGMPTRHFEKIYFVDCPQTLFFYEDIMRLAENSHRGMPFDSDVDDGYGECPRPRMIDFLLRRPRVAPPHCGCGHDTDGHYQCVFSPNRAFWANVRDLLAPGGHVLINSLPWHFGGVECECTESTDPPEPLYDLSPKCCGCEVVCQTINGRRYCWRERFHEALMCLAKEEGVQLADTWNEPREELAHVMGVDLVLGQHNRDERAQKEPTDMVYAAAGA